MYGYHNHMIYIYIEPQTKLLTKYRGRKWIERVVEGERTAYNKTENILCTLPADTTCQLDVFGHDGDTLGVDGAQVGVLKQTHQVGFAGLLQGRETGNHQSVELNSWFVK